MFGWFIALSLGLSWACTQFLKRPNWLVLKALLPVPKSHLASKQMWHDIHCNPLPGHECRSINLTFMQQEQIDQLPQALLLKAKQRVRTLIAVNPLFKMVEPVKLADFSCCWVGGVHQWGYALAESDDQVITLELATPNDNVLRIACSNKNHCISAPMLPLGFVTYSASRQAGTWPDHWHTWLVWHENARAKIEPNEVAIWNRLVLPSEPRVSYDIIVDKIKRYISAVPVYYYDTRAMVMARAACGVPLPEDEVDFNAPLVSATVTGLRESIDELYRTFKSFVSNSDSQRFDLTSRTQSLELKVKELSEKQASVSREFLEIAEKVQSRLDHVATQLKDSDTRNLNKLTVIEKEDGTFKLLDLHARCLDLGVAYDDSQTKKLVDTLIDERFVDFSQTSTDVIDDDVAKHKGDSVYYKRLVSAADASQQYIGPQGECNCQQATVLGSMSQVQNDVSNLKKIVDELQFHEKLEVIHSALIQSFSSLPATLYYAFCRQHRSAYRIWPSAKSVAEITIWNMEKDEGISVRKMLTTYKDSKLIKSVLDTPVVIVPTPKGAYIRIADATIEDNTNLSLRDVLPDGSEYNEVVFV